MENNIRELKALARQLKKENKRLTKENRLLTMKHNNIKETYDGLCFASKELVKDMNRLRKNLEAAEGRITLFEHRVHAFSPLSLFK